MDVRDRGTLAKDLGVSQDTALGYLREGLVPGFQLRRNGKWHIDPGVYADWKRTQRGRPVADGPAPQDEDRIEPRSARSKARMRRGAA